MSLESPVSSFQTPYPRVVFRWFEHLEANHPVGVNIANAVILTAVVWWATGVPVLGIIVGVVVAYFRVRSWREGGGFRLRYEEKYGPPPPEPEN